MCAHCIVARAALGLFLPGFSLVEDQVSSWEELPPPPAPRALLYHSGTLLFVQLMEEYNVVEIEQRQFQKQLDQMQTLIDRANKQATFRRQSKSALRACGACCDLTFS